MLREAAYLGKPAISIFSGPRGAVDRMLERSGATRHIERAEELDVASWLDAGSSVRIAHRPEVVDELAERILTASQQRLSSLHS